VSPVHCVLRQLEKNLETHKRENKFKYQWNHRHPPYQPTTGRETGKEETLQVITFNKIQSKKESQRGGKGPQRGKRFKSGGTRL